MIEDENLDVMVKVFKSDAEIKLYTIYVRGIAVGEEGVSLEEALEDFGEYIKRF